jgi:hypothetical protein
MSETRTQNEARERRALAGAEVVELTEALTRIRSARGCAGLELQGLDRRRRLVALAAVSGDGDAAGRLPEPGCGGLPRQFRSSPVLRRGRRGRLHLGEPRGLGGHGHRRSRLRDAEVA